jgi:mono/diheme cytochrome c family protein
MTPRHAIVLFTAFAFAFAFVLAALAGVALAATPATTTKTTTTAVVPGNAAAAAAGKKLFVAQQCGSCHMMAAANAYDGSGVGPDLDRVTKTYAQIVAQITKGGGGMTPYKGVLTTVQIGDLATFIYATSHPK